MRAQKTTKRHMPREQAKQHIQLLGALRFKLFKVAILREEAEPESSLCYAHEVVDNQGQKLKCLSNNSADAKHPGHSCVDEFRLLETMDGY